ncbi:MAG: hypothetical protein MJZ53_06925 [Paludibacteraceae bacterium]|nr:hypothetical protein [Paludibacteraceae bacterium]
MEEKNINEQESLQIIQQMLVQTRNNVVKGKIFLWVGYSLALLFAVSLACLLIWRNQPMSFNIIWWLLFTYAVVIGFCFRVGKLSFGSHDGVKTYIEKTLHTIWTSVYAMFLILILTMGVDILYGDYDTLYLNMLVVNCCVVMAGIATSIIFKSKHVNVSTFLTGIFFSQLLNFGTFATRTPWRNMCSVLVVGLLIIIVVFIIQGHKLNRVAKREMEEQNKA